MNIQQMANRLHTKYCKRVFVPLRQIRFIHVVLILLFSMFCEISFAMQRIDIYNNSLSRTFSLHDGLFFTTGLKNMNTGKEYIRGNSLEFLFHVDGKQVTSGSFDYESHTLSSDEGVQLMVILRGKNDSNAEGLVVRLYYWVYEDLPVVRKKIDIENHTGREISITDLDTENLNLDVSGVHYSEIYTSYGQNFEKKPYKGNYNDAAILMYDPRISQGVILGNEALSVMKRTEIYTNGFPIVRIGLAASDDTFPFRVYLDPGETFSSPGTFICLVEADSWQVAFEGVFADFLREHLGVRFFMHESPPLLMYNTWRPFRTNITEEIVMASADALEGSGTDLFIIDCGWYDMMGNYYPDREKFPNGLEPVCDYIREKGLQVGLWLSFATANVESEAVKNHPEWIVKDKNGDPVLVHVTTGETLGEVSYTMSMASPWYDYIREKIAHYVRTCSLSYIKLDLAAALGSYQPDPAVSGDYEGGGVKLYKDRESSFWLLFQKTLELCDDLHKEFPDLMIDYTYETHGRHNGVDYALLQHAEYDWLTNYELEPPAGPVSIRQIRYRRARTMPVSTLLIGNQNMINPTREMDKYTFLSVASATGILVGDVRQMDDETRQWYRKWNEWFREMNDRFQFTHYYQVGDVFDFPTMQNWDGCYRFNTRKEGGVLFFYRNGSLDDTRSFRVHCVSPESIYRIYDPEEERVFGVFTGTELLTAGIRIELPMQFSAKVLGIEKITR